MSRASTLSYQRRGGGGGPHSLSARTTTPASPVGKWPGRRRLGGGGARGVAPSRPRPPLPSSAGRQPPEARARADGGRSCSLRAGGGSWVPHLCSSSAPASSDMVAPGSVTSRLGSVFPFLLVLVDLQYEGESCPAPAGGAGSRTRPRSASPPPSRHESRGGRGGGAGAGDSAAWLGPKPAPGRGPAPGSGFVWGRGAGTGGPRGRDRGFGVRSGADRVRVKRGTGQRLLGRPGTRRPGQPSAPGLARDPRLAPGDSWSVVLGGGGKGGPRWGGFFGFGVPGGWRWGGCPAG